MEHVKPIGPLRMDGNIAENWRKWKQRWTLYAKASGVDAKDEQMQCAVFLHTIGDEALEVYDTFTFTENEENKIESLRGKFDAYCSPKKNVTYERYLFFRVHKTAGQSTLLSPIFAQKLKPANLKLFRIVLSKIELCVE